MIKKAKGGDTEIYIQEGLLALLPIYQDGAGKTVVFTLGGKYPDPRGAPWLLERLAAYYSVNLPELRRRCSKLLALKHHISLPLSENMVLLPVRVRQAAARGETTTGFINLLQVQEILPPGQCAPGNLTPPPGQCTPGNLTPPPAQCAPGKTTPLQSQFSSGQSTIPRPTCPATPGHLSAVYPKPAQPNPGQPGPKAINPEQPQPRQTLPESHSPPRLHFPKQERPGPPPGRHPFASAKENPAWLSRVQFKCGLQLKTLNSPATLRGRLRQGEIVLQDFLRRRSQGPAFPGLTRQALLEQLPNCDCILKDIFIELFGLKVEE